MSITGCSGGLKAANTDASSNGNSLQSTGTLIPPPSAAPSPTPSQTPAPSPAPTPSQAPAPMVPGVPTSVTATAGGSYPDIVWQNSDGQTSIWFMNGTTRIGGGPVTAAGSTVALNPGPTWNVAGVGDFNGDGFMDILWQNSDGSTSIWFMNGTTRIGGGPVTAAGSTVALNPGPTWKIVPDIDRFESGTAAVTEPVAAPGPINCNEAYQPSADISVEQTGTWFSTRIGVSTALSGIGVEFSVRNNSGVDGWFNLLETRSAAGAAWQTSLVLTDADNTLYINNQAAGNPSSLWGFLNSFTQLGNELNSNSFSSLYPVTISNPISGTSNTVNPCTTSGLPVFYQGRPFFNGTTVSVGGNTANYWTSQYQWQSTVGNQSWVNWQPEQAFYLNKQLAQSANLRIYVQTPTQKLGPIYPYNRFETQFENETGQSCFTSVAGMSGSFCTDVWTGTSTQTYAVLVWNIEGTDLGIAIPNLQYGFSLVNNENVYCSNVDDPTCGDVDWHTYMSRGPRTDALGELVELGVGYYVGTLDQLAALGFPTPGHGGW
jgi:hypothetical protein